MANPVVSLAGASGDLGFRIARALIDRGADVRAIVRPDVSPAERARLETIGLDLTDAHPRDRDALATACAGSMCVVSALNGVRDVLIDRQGKREATALPGGTQQQPVVVELATPKSSAFAVARAVIEPVLGPLETTVIVIIVSIFILMQREDLRDRFIRLFGSRDLHRTTIAMDDAGQRLSRYFVSQLGVDACFGVVIGVGLWLIGIPSPALWGVLAGLLRFVPYVGPMLAAVGPSRWQRLSIPAGGPRSTQRCYS